MIRLVDEPLLRWPTVAVRTSYLVGEQANGGEPDGRQRGEDRFWIQPDVRQPREWPANGG